MRISKYPISRNTRTLLPHQKSVLRYMMSTKTPALFIDMRLGKTILTIEYAIRKGLKNVLVVAPLSTLNSWERELTVEGIDSYKVPTERTVEVYQKIRRCPWVLINPQKLAPNKRCSSWGFHERQWDMIVIDESSRIKNARSGYFKELMKYYSKIPHRVLLSGTPTPEDILEAVPQLLFLHGDVMGCKSYWEFLAKYTMKIGYDRRIYKSAREKLLGLLHDKCYFLSQKEAGIQQPTCYIKLVHKKSEQQIQLLRQLREEFELDLNGKHYETVHVLPTLTWACRIVGGIMDGTVLNDSKYRSLKKIIQETEGQVVVWYRFNEELQYCYKRLAEDGVRVRAYYGDVSVSDRKILEDDFKQGKYDVLLLQVKTGLYALDLSRADTAVYYSNTWSLEERLQSEKRISHPSKKSKLKYIDLVTKGWPDTNIYTALRKKNISAKMIWEDWKYE